MPRCAACGRQLRVPSPSGLGPVCGRRLGVTAARVAPAGPSAAGPVALIEGQTELPLADHQPTLWSL